MLVVCLVCGLPGAGKSTVLRRLRSLSADADEGSDGAPPAHTTVLFDDLLDFVRGREGSGSGSGVAAPFSPELWHTAQAALLGVVACVSGCDDAAVVASCGGDAAAAAHAAAYVEETKATAAPSPAILFVEDNFYYRSMRARFRRLCGSAGCAFASVWFETSEALCVARNAGRQGAERVPEDTIRRMHAAVTAAAAAEGAADDRLAALPTEGRPPEELAAALLEVCAAAAARGAEPDVAALQRKRGEEAEAQRQATAASLAHALDQGLRRAVPAVLAAASGELTPAARKAVGQRVAELKKRALKGAAAQPLQGEEDIVAVVDTFMAAAWSALTDANPS